VTKSDVYNLDYDNKLNITVTPNPINNISVVEFDTKGNKATKVELLNQVGQSIPIYYEPVAGFNRFTLNSESLGLSNGVYYLKIVTQNNVYVTKIIKGN